MANAASFKTYSSFKSVPITKREQALAYILSANMIVTMGISIMATFTTVAILLQPADGGGHDKWPNAGNRFRHLCVEEKNLKEHQLKRCYEKGQEKLRERVQAGEDPKVKQEYAEDACCSAEPPDCVEITVRNRGGYTMYIRGGGMRYCLNNPEEYRITDKTGQFPNPQDRTVWVIKGKHVQLRIFTYLEFKDEGKTVKRHGTVTCTGSTYINRKCEGDIDKN